MNVIVMSVVVVDVTTESDVVENVTPTRRLWMLEILDLCGKSSQEVDAQQTVRSSQAM